MSDCCLKVENWKVERIDKLVLHFGSTSTVERVVCNVCSRFLGNRPVKGDSADKRKGRKAKGA